MGRASVSRDPDQIPFPLLANRGRGRNLSHLQKGKMLAYESCGGNPGFAPGSNLSFISHKLAFRAYLQSLLALPLVEHAPAGTLGLGALR